LPARFLVRIFPQQPAIGQARFALSETPPISTAEPTAIHLPDADLGRGLAQPMWPRPADVTLRQ